MKNVYQRISSVMQDVEYLTKDDSVSTGKSSYRAITEEKVTSAVRASLIKNGLVILPIEQTRTRTDERITAYDNYNKRETERINRIVSVDVKYKIQNIDEKDDFVIVSSSGEGVDTQDKGVGKAMTYSYKYMLLRSFAIPTGEDPDKISSDIYSEKLYGKREEQSKYQPNVYDGRLEAMRKEILSIDDEAKIEAACNKKYNKNLQELKEAELQEILGAIRAKKQAAVTRQ